MRSLAVLLLFGLASCASVSDLRYGEGVTLTVEGIPYDEVWERTRSALIGVIPIVGEDKRHGLIYAENGATAYSWGEAVRIDIRRIDAGRDDFVISIVSRRHVAINVTARNWEPELEARIRQSLGV